MRTSKLGFKTSTIILKLHLRKTKTKTKNTVSSLKNSATLLSNPGRPYRQGTTGSPGLNHA